MSNQRQSVALGLIPLCGPILFYPASPSRAVLARLLPAVVAFPWHGSQGGRGQVGAGCGKAGKGEIELEENSTMSPRRPWRCPGGPRAPRRGRVAALRRGGRSPAGGGGGEFRRLAGVSQKKCAGTGRARGLPASANVVCCHDTESHRARCGAVWRSGPRGAGRATTTFREDQGFPCVAARRVLLNYSCK